MSSRKNFETLQKLSCIPYTKILQGVTIYQRLKDPSWATQHHVCLKHSSEYSHTYPSLPFCLCISWLETWKNLCQNRIHIALLVTFQGRGRNIPYVFQSYTSTLSSFTPSPLNTSSHYLVTTAGESNRK